MPVMTESAVVEELSNELARLRREFETRAADIEKKLRALAPAEIAQERDPIEKPQTRTVTPETIAIIAAAVTSFLGKKVKIRNARQIDSGTTPWAQQGRAIIQASHNLSR